MVLDPYNVTVRIYEPTGVNKGVFLGSGFLISDSVIITCAHVVKDLEVVLIELAAISELTFKVNVTEKNYAIDVAIITLNPALDFGDQYPLLIDIDYSELEGHACSIYGRTSDQPNGAWTELIIGKNINAFLIESQLTSGFSIIKGYSGSPLWLKDYRGIIGMVKGSNLNANVINFIGAKHLLNFTKKAGLSLSTLTQPKYPENYFRIESRFSRIQEILKRKIEKPCKLLVICGASGIGKTALVTDVFNDFNSKKHWFYCRILYNEKIFKDVIKPLDQNDLLVLEDVYENHPIVNKQWLMLDIKCNIIITTTTRKTALEILDKNKLNNRQRYLYELESLSKEESIGFVSYAMRNKFDKNITSEILSITKGYPIFLKLVIDIMSESRSKDFEESFDYSHTDFVKNAAYQQLSENELHKVILEKWFETPEIGRLHTDVMFVLSKITNLGISYEGLLFILGCKDNELRSCLSLLKRKGFVNINISPEKDEKVIGIQQILSQIIASGFSNAREEEYEDRYIEFLKGGINGKHEHEKTIVERIDLLIIELKRLWEKTTEKTIDGETFINLLEKKSCELDRLLPNNCGSKAKSQWIAQLFQPVGDKDCTIIIPIARAIPHLHISEVLAEMMWQATKNLYTKHPDALARSCAIYSAFFHWSRISTLNKKDILKKLNFHLNELYRLDSSEDTDMEIGVMLGGLCAIGLCDEAIAIAEDMRFINQFKTSTYGILILAIGLLQNNSYSEKIEALINKRFSSIKESEGKTDVVHFLRIKGFLVEQHIECTQRYEINVRGDKIFGISRYISKGAHSNDFDKFVTIRRGESSFL